MPFPVAFRLTRHNRNSIAAVLAVLETELGADSFEPTFLTSPVEFNGAGLLVYSFTTREVGQVRRELDDLSARFGPALRAIAGGCHASAELDATLALGFRWVAIGEAGPDFAALVRGLAEGREPPPGAIRQVPAEDLDRYPSWPASGRLFAHIEITRGCPMACAFCQTPRLFGRRARHRSLEALGRAFVHGVETGHRYTRFVAPNAFAYGSEDGHTANPSAVEALLVTARRSGFERVYLGTFPSEVRPETVSETMLGIVRAHCDNDTLAVGMQSGSDETLRRIRRGHTVAQGVAAVERIAAAGFTPRVDFIFGLPGETDSDRANTRAVIRHLAEDCGARIHAHPFTPLPGTPLADATPSEVDSATYDLMESLAGRHLATGLTRPAHGGSRPPCADEGPDAP